MPLIFRNLLPIGLAALLVWLVAPMFSTRMDAMHTSTVIGAVTAFSAVTSHHRSSGKYSSSYTVVRYTLPDTWPIAAGSTQSYVIPWASSSSNYEIGADIQLKFLRADSPEPLIFSFEGFWIAPLAIVVLGSAIILPFAFFAPSPSAQELRILHRARAKRRKRAGKSAGLAEAAASLEPAIAQVKQKPQWRRFLDTIAPIFSPLLLIMAVPALLMAAPFILIADALRTMVVRLWHVLKPVDDEESEERIGVIGLLVDLVQSASLIGVMTGFAVGCGFATVHAADKVAGKLSWSLAPINTLRTILWLPQDFDGEFCAARERQDAYANRWLLAHGARQNVVCETQPDAAAERE